MILTCESRFLDTLHSQSADAAKLSKLDMANNVQLFPGEVEQDRDTMVYEWNGHSGVKCAWHLGVLTLTNFRIIFTPTNISTYVSTNRRN